MRLLCWNINALLPTVPNFALTHPPGPLLGFFRHHALDVVCFQETKLVEQKLTRELACVEGWESFWAIAEQPKGRAGVVTYVTDAFSPVSAKVDALGGQHEVFNKEGRCVVVDLGAFVLFNVYVPNAGKRGEDTTRADIKKRFLRALKVEADELVAAGREVLIVGDLNIAASQQDVHSGLDYAQMYDPEEKGLLRGLLGAFPDTWRALHLDTADRFSVWDERTNKRPFNQGVRIDYALASPGLAAKVVSCEFLDLPPKWSDHDGFVLELRDIAPPPPHPPCAQSSKRHPRFGGSRSLKAMFQARAPPGRAAPRAGGAGAGAAAAKPASAPAVGGAVTKQGSAAPGAPGLEEPAAAAEEMRDEGPAPSGRPTDGAAATPHSGVGEEPGRGGLAGKAGKSQAGQGATVPDGVSSPVEEERVRSEGGAGPAVRGGEGPAEPSRAGSSATEKGPGAGGVERGGEDRKTSSAAEGGCVPVAGEGQGDPLLAGASAGAASTASGVGASRKGAPQAQGASLSATGLRKRANSSAVSTKPDKKQQKLDGFLKKGT